MADADEKTRRDRAAKSNTGILYASNPTNGDLRALAHMFEPHRTDPLMRELCRLAIKCAQEGLTRARQ